MQAAAQSLGLHLVTAEANNGQIDAAFATFIQRGVGALFVGAAPFYSRDGRESSIWPIAMPFQRCTPSAILYWPEG